MFSEAVDRALARTKRGNLLEDHVAYLNTTLREIASLHNFYRNMVELTVTCTAADHEWTRPRLFQKMLAVEYPSVYGERIFPQQLQPGRLQKLEEKYWYAGPSYFVFVGTEIDDVIRIAYNARPAEFTYYAEGSRPAVFDTEAGTWSYLLDGAYVSTLGSDALDEAAKAKVWHWILEDWRDVAIQGTMAKIHLQVSNKEGASPFFALYKSLQGDLERVEPFVSLEE